MKIKKWTLQLGLACSLLAAAPAASAENFEELQGTWTVECMYDSKRKHLTDVSLKIKDNGITATWTYYKNDGSETCSAENKVLKFRARFRMTILADAGPQPTSEESDIGVTQIRGTDRFQPFTKEWEFVLQSMSPTSKDLESIVLKLLRRIKNHEPIEDSDLSSFFSRSKFTRLANN